MRFVTSDPRTGGFADQLGGVLGLVSSGTITTLVKAGTGDTAWTSVPPLLPSTPMAPTKCPVVTSDPSSGGGRAAQVNEIVLYDNSGVGQYMIKYSTGNTDWVQLPDTTGPGGGGLVADGDKGDITVTGSGITWTIDNDVVTNAKLRNSSALSVIGRSVNSSGDPADIAASSDGDVLRRSGTTLGFGLIPESSVTSLVADLAARPTGSGSLNTLPKWTSTTSLGDSHVSDDGSTVTATGSFSAGLTGGLSSIIQLGDVSTDATHTVGGHLKIKQTTVDSSPALYVQNDAQIWAVQNRGASSDQLIIRDETAARDIFTVTKSTGRSIWSGQVTIAPAYETAGVALTITQASGSSRALTIQKNTSQAMWRIAGGSDELLQLGGITGTGITSMQMGPSTSTAPEFTLSTTAATFIVPATVTSTTGNSVTANYTGTTQTTDRISHVVSNTGSYDCSAAQRIAYGLFITSAPTKSAAGNNLNAFALSINATGGDTNHAIRTGTGDNLFNITSGNTAIGTTINASAKLLVGGETWSQIAVGATLSSSVANFRALDSTAFAAGVGGSVTFHGIRTGTSQTTGGIIKASRVTAVDNSVAFDLILGSRAALSADVQENIRLLSTGGALVTGPLTVTGNAAIGDDDADSHAFRGFVAANKTLTTGVVGTDYSVSLNDLTAHGSLGTGGMLRFKARISAADSTGSVTGLIRASRDNINSGDFQSSLILAVPNAAGTLAAKFTVSTGGLAMGSTSADSHTLTGALVPNGVTGNNGDILTRAAGLPTWAAPSAVTGISDEAFATTFMMMGA